MRLGNQLILDNESREDLFEGIEEN